MELISNANQWHRLWSMRFSILAAFFGAIVTAYATLPGDWLPAIPNWAKFALAGGTLLTPALAAVSRIVKQPSLAPVVPTVPAAADPKQ